MDANSPHTAQEGIICMLHDAVDCIQVNVTMFKHDRSAVLWAARCGATDSEIRSSGPWERYASYEDLYFSCCLCLYKCAADLVCIIGSEVYFTYAQSGRAIQMIQESLYGMDREKLWWPFKPLATSNEYA